MTNSELKTKIADAKDLTMGAAGTGYSIFQITKGKLDIDFGKY